MFRELARQVTSEEHRKGYVVCGCERFAFVIKASILQQLPSDYHGERCEKCNCWMVAVEKLTSMEGEHDQVPCQIPHE